MKSLFIILLIINLTSGLFKLSVRKCTPNDDYSINYLRYQYDYKHYPQFCDYNNKHFDEKNIEYMKYSLDRFWYPCDYEYNNLNISFFDKNIHFWKNIWYDYGSCSKLDQYDYFNTSLVLFYNYKSIFKNCYFEDQYCEHYYENIENYIGNNLIQIKTDFIPNNQKYKKLLY